MLKKKLKSFLAPRVKSLTPKLKEIENIFLTKGKRSPFRGRQPSLTQKVSLIVPTYNVEMYFDEFLRSIVNQSTGLHNLEIIVVDDGSKDGSSTIAKKWQTSHPNTIKYVYQENQGLCSARNTGINHATGDWISFPDPDDFLDVNYLHNVNKALIKGKHQKLELIVANFIVYDERDNKWSDRHGLRYRFQKAQSWLRIDDMKDFIQLAANSSFMKRSIIECNELKFDLRIKPGFEDAQFVNRYLLRCTNSTAVFLKAAIYNYRKRANESSMQDGAKLKKEFYYNQLQYGWLNLLKEAKSLIGYVPRHIQRTVLYDAVGRLDTISRIQKFPIKLTESEISTYKNLIIEAFSYIDEDVIETANFHQFYENLKVGCLAYFKKVEREETTSYIRHFEPHSGLLELFFYSSNKPTVQIYNSSDEEITPISVKTITHKFFQDAFYYETIVNTVVPAGKIQLLINNELSKIKLKDKVSRKVISFNDLVSSTSKPVVNIQSHNHIVLREKILSSDYSSFNDCWLILDRPDKADDNGEHFYNYMMKNQKQKNCFFILSKESKDWNRLNKLGFRLIDYGSNEHKAALIRAKWVISSHGDRFIRMPFPSEGINDLCKFKFAFLQHGVTYHDQSEWFNTMQPNALFTATTDEYKSFTNIDCPYNFSNGRVHLTGFSRHDTLLARSSSNDIIFIMPTWRQNLTTTKNGEMKRELIDDYLSSNYAVHWRDILNSQELRLISKHHNQRVIFCPHPNMISVISDMDIPEYIEVINVLDIESLQPYFSAMSLMITDYSSVAFESGYLDKPVIYYQFDLDTFYGDHIYRKGYFDTIEHGFGPVCTSQMDVEYNVRKTFDGEEDEIYRQRRLKTFPYRDGKCSERIYSVLIN